MGADEKLAALGIVLPPPLKLPPGMVLPFPWVNVRGDRAYISGHGPQEPDGALAGPFGAVGESVSLEEARATARKVGLSMLSSLRRELGNLDRITGWCRVHGMVNAAPGFTQTPAVMNGFSDLILEIFGPEIGRHARTASGVAALPFDLPVEIEAEVMIVE
ncbi:RidA family protein [Mesorhizobium sp. VK23B]|uniref:RidA family protein n=1 Tax=Mesorhizobium dulcispinae TaxID=3072316 RepID=A0ABU4XAP0_9HYPH|nr:MULTISPECIES: RidA family protein [unclassified Mesorhizobium]MDX8466039.1 RidA family protein [Mesorhizobium sp. VK23B]MDX8471850.1 RidA family protein [Mesorhizobium sp. VK23A]